jgi:hypothetical protein
MTVEHRSNESPANRARNIRNTVYLFRVTANYSKWGLLSMSRSNEYRQFAAECLKMAQTAEEEQNRAIFLQMARVWFALAEREEARSSRNDHPEAYSKCPSYLLLSQPLPQPLSKLLPFPAILFVRPPSVQISLGGGIRPRIFRYCAGDCSTREQSFIPA